MVIAAGRHSPRKRRRPPASRRTRRRPRTLREEAAGAVRGARSP